jgi:glycolate oxidase
MATRVVPNAVTDEVIAALERALGREKVLTDFGARVARTRVPAPFPVHRFADHMPDVVVLPESAEEVSAVLRIANEYRVPVVPRAGGTGLADGAVPLHKGILLDIKKMNKILDLDLVNRTVTVQPGLNMLKLNEFLAPYGVFYPDDPASYPVSIIGGRIGTSGWSLIGARYGHTRDLVISLQVVLPTGEIVRLADGGGAPKVRKASTGYNLKQLFIGTQGTLGVVTEATLELFPKPEAELAAFFGYESFEDAYRSTGALSTSGLGTLAAVILFDERKVEYLRRDDEAYIPLPERIKAVVATALYGVEEEVRAAAQRLHRIARETGGEYLGDELSAGDWASRHDRYATPLHGRLPDGTVVPMSWHCEDAAIIYSELPAIKQKWHEITDRYIQKYGIFDNWGMFFYSNNPYKGWGDYLVEIDIGIWEQALNEETWQAWVNLKREITRATLEHQGSISACHGACREGDAEFIPVEMSEGGFELMKRIKRLLDPNNILNPSKNYLHLAYVDEEMGGAS